MFCPLEIRHFIIHFEINDTVSLNLTLFEISYTEFLYDLSVWICVFYILIFSFRLVYFEEFIIVKEELVMFVTKSIVINLSAGFGRNQ